MCVLSALFGWIFQVAEDPVVRRLPAAAAAELQLLACLAPARATNVRAPCLSALVATDASETRLGVAAAPVAPSVAAELVRLRDRRGAPT
eukprot:5176104-Alexandrium_andersonii.AAC.1